MLFFCFTLSRRQKLEACDSRCRCLAATKTTPREEFFRRFISCQSKNWWPDVLLWFYHTLLFWIFLVFFVMASSTLSKIVMCLYFCVVAWYVFFFDKSSLSTKICCENTNLVMFGHLSFDLGGNNVETEPYKYVNGFLWLFPYKDSRNE